ncbi:MAG: 3-oxoacyl-(acyl-carrier-protein) synthase/3-hydroxymyristoyl [Myxococcota bacterium]|jgi:3-oxoacyl-(acyl-carrier-protein) synthase/3-hydroxymyristoyl/3-hydroxydecanoyl-(acyl carrier protein) dehydratase/1-acyl-sn-glycerol-3-phosphate acyltransferase
MTDDGGTGAAADKVDHGTTSAHFPAIAIVGQGCVLPGALTPEALHAALLEGRDLVSRVPEGRWGISAERSSIERRTGAPEYPWTERGGYVRGFDEVFDPASTRLDAALVQQLDPLFQWLMYAAGCALAGSSTDRARTGAIVGNLSFPSASAARFSEACLLDGQPPAIAAHAPQAPAAVNRFMSGLPAHLLAHAHGLGAGAFALDAACASSLYAIRLACDALHDGRADAMLAGAVACCDDLFIHTGFCALQALSRTGQSRPFSSKADGLLPAEGCALVLLKRLEDAERDGDTIHGVIRGVGLSNDGRSGGILSPSAGGQVRAMEAAYRMAGWSPSDVQVVECHATGTLVGDKVELESMAHVFAGARGLPIGSVKSNMGHPITAAGGVGLLKILGAFAAGQIPPTLHTGSPSAALLASPFRLLSRAEPWNTHGPRRAALSAFGFGGNNAHLLVEEYGGHGSALPPALSADEVVVVRLGARVADLGSADALRHAVVSGTRHIGPAGGRTEAFEVGLRGLRFPPKDLLAALPQQVAILEATREAVHGLTLPRETTGVFVGMSADAEVGRFGARWRVREWGVSADDGWIERTQDAIVPHLESAGVLGTMPNVPANRLNVQLDVAGPSFTVSSEEHSGLDALEIGVRMLRSGELDVAVVGAVDLCCEPIHQRAAAALLPPDRHTPGDAAVVLVLMRRSTASAHGLTPLAVLGGPGGGQRLGEGGPTVEAQFGHAHAASGLLEVAAAVLRCAQDGQPVEVASRSFAAPTRLTQVRSAGGRSAASAPVVEAGPTLRMPAHWPSVMLTSPPDAVVPSRRAPAVAVRPNAPVTPASAADGWADLVAQVSHAHRNWMSEHTAAHLNYLAVAQHALSALEGSPRPPASQRRPRVMLQPAPAPVQVAPAVVAPPPPPPAPPRPVVYPKPGAEKNPNNIRVGPRGAPFPRFRRAPHAAALPGPKIDRDGLKIISSGRISEVYGPLFAQQDGYDLQCRMPEEPLLLADRCLGIDATPGVLGRGTLWSETDVGEHAWYLNQDGTIPPGLMIECGQADLMLISWMGIDFLNKGERVYRLLGCDLTYRRSLPRRGETLSYDIHVDGHANHGDVRLFFFHYDCCVDGRPVLAVRNGQAGFFTYDELASSTGILWSPEDANWSTEGPLDPPVVACTRSSFTEAQVTAFSEGRAAECFGPGFEALATHHRTPKIQFAPMRFVDRVTHFDPVGGPWGRGYLRVELDIRPDDWFFDGHFKNDPCMPGTLMFEGCMQAMAFYLAAMGYTLDRDGWRFEPVLDHTVPLRCRGEVGPDSTLLVCELFIENVSSGPNPTVYADLMGTVGEQKAFYAKRMGYSLVPDPLYAPDTLPLTRFTEVPAGRAEALDLAPVQSFWRRWFGLGQWPVEDIQLGLAERFVRRVVFEDPGAMRPMRGRGALYVANHQVALESLLCAVLLGGLMEIPLVTLAKAEHQHTWMGKLNQRSFSWPGAAERDPGVLAFFDRTQSADLQRILGPLFAQAQVGTRSLMVHVEGTRSLECRSPVTTLSGVFTDLAIAHDVPIVPVRLWGGLPVSPTARRLDFPVGLGQQDILVGRPIEAAELRGLPLKARKDRVLGALNDLGGPRASEAPLAGDPGFAEAVRGWCARTGSGEAHSVLYNTLLHGSRQSEGTEALLRGVEAGRLVVPPGPEGDWLAGLAGEWFGDGLAIERG